MEPTLARVGGAHLMHHQLDSIGRQNSLAVRSHNDTSDSLSAFGARVLRAKVPAQTAQEGVS